MDTSYLSRCRTDKHKAKMSFVKDGYYSLLKKIRSAESDCEAIVETLFTDHPIPLFENSRQLFEKKMFIPTSPETAQKFKKEESIEDMTDEYRRCYAIIETIKILLHIISQKVSKEKRVNSTEHAELENSSGTYFTHLLEGSSSKLNSISQSKAEEIIANDFKKEAGNINSARVVEEVEATGSNISEKAADENSWGSNHLSEQALASGPKNLVAERGTISFMPVPQPFKQDNLIPSTSKNQQLQPQFLAPIQTKFNGSSAFPQAFGVPIQFGAPSSVYTTQPVFGKTIPAPVGFSQFPFQLPYLAQLPKLDGMPNQQHAVNQGVVGRVDGRKSDSNPTCGQFDKNPSDTNKDSNEQKENDLKEKNNNTKKTQSGIQDQKNADIREENGKLNDLQKMDVKNKTIQKPFVKQESDTHIFSLLSETKDAENSVNHSEKKHDKKERQDGGEENEMKKQKARSHDHDRYKASGRARRRHLRSKHKEKKQRDSAHCDPEYNDAGAADDDSSDRSEESSESSSSSSSSASLKSSQIPSPFQSTQPTSVPREAVVTPEALYASENTRDSSPASTPVYSQTYPDAEVALTDYNHENKNPSAPNDTTPDYKLATSNSLSTSPAFNAPPTNTLVPSSFRILSAPSILPRRYQSNAHFPLLKSPRPSEPLYHEASRSDRYVHAPHGLSDIYERDASAGSSALGSMVEQSLLRYTPLTPLSPFTAANPNSSLASSFSSALHFSSCAMTTPGSMPPSPSSSPSAGAAGELASSNTVPSFLRHSSPFIASSSSSVSQSPASTQGFTPSLSTPAFSFLFEEQDELGLWHETPIERRFREKMLEEDVLFGETSSFDEISDFTLSFPPESDG
ncbi:uncharacterized protein MONOS_8942 [Monocercomonoides exilis]|uniref:uncharacterized protein n=1 Tax=Monocercomonoides exilis TaxID=2049356 RepID=UPI00355ABAF0|nr:hypothetical protein MONOS_8942 [Monocercomonoides exilis]|eukprot:MONOS_8942.1-p1 / transcript=MONOS_8942.1 / gene=MONOS_8942 / organism=Monocercomonoides_exilis_PA203 / gene_product=unspecified product / transcript_product=unspecified product / location=Mono_scaffold00352:42302-44970(-) / protein_length=854 / sequence_SO=supercontig / SO=protein_coding / is_pseudo=false